MIIAKISIIEVAAARARNVGKERKNKRLSAVFHII